MPTAMKLLMVVVFVLWLAARWPDDDFPEGGATA